MKILYFITKSNWGGAQRHVFDLSKWSKDSGHETAVALGGNGPLKQNLDKQGIRTIPIKSLGRDINAKGDTASFLDIFKIIRKERPDILHLHSSKAGGVGSFAGRILGVKKIIYTIHGSPWNEDRPFLQKTLIVFFSWLSMIFSTHIVMLSEKEISQAQMFPFIKKKLRLIELGIPPLKFLTQKDSKVFIQSKMQEPLEKRIVVGTISELHPNKGLIYALNAFSKLIAEFPDAIFFIIGEGEQRDYLESFIKERGLEKNVVLAGYTEEAYKYLKGFSIFLLSSIKEGFPYVILEAGLAGLPVISTAVGGIPEIIDDMESGVLVQSKKPDEIFHAIDFVIKHKNIQKEYGKSLQEKVKDKFSLKIMLDKIDKLYKEKN